MMYPDQRKRGVYYTAEMLRNSVVKGYDLEEPSWYIVRLYNPDTQSRDTIATVVSVDLEHARGEM